RAFSDTLSNQSEVVLDADESRHITCVLRAKKDAKIEVFNGHGLVGYGIITIPDKKATRVKITGISKTKPANTQITLIHATLTNKNTDLVVKESTAIGVQNIWIFESDHSESKIKDKIESKLDHWKKLSIEACKQSGNRYLPNLYFASKLIDIKIPCKDSLRLFGNICITSQPLLRCLNSAKSGNDIVFAIGPEGDFSENEKQYLLKKGFIGCSLGTNILRAETASIYALSVINSHLEATNAR
ncbi:MAG: 16S rRNA (uracil(1498)-N(3))-methyltransferase, partial [Opitutales bacterium]|nr:16S rRNA (uracil(1498)-N(3))-methyltransferase [Opitutales bacterium]